MEGPSQVDTNSAEFTSIVRLLTALLLYARRTANHAADFLDRLASTRKMRKPDQELIWPAELMLEAAAVVILAKWEQGGLASHLGADLPLAGDALRGMLDRMQADLASFEADPDRASSALFSRQWLLWLHRFAWSAQEAVGADIVITGTVQPEALQVLADFLWKHRRVVSEIVEDGRRQDGS